jgi:hypothetical protein
MRVDFGAEACAVLRFAPSDRSFQGRKRFKSQQLRRRNIWTEH